jgi:hypothetical protein
MKYAIISAIFMFGMVSGAPDITLINQNSLKGTPGEINQLATKINNATENNELQAKLEIKKINNQIIDVTISFQDGMVTSINATYQNDGSAQNNITPADLNIVKTNLQEVAQKLMNPLKRNLSEKANHINQTAGSASTGNTRQPTAGGPRVIPDS